MLPFQRLRDAGKTMIAGARNGARAPLQRTAALASARLDALMEACRKTSATIPTSPRSQPRWEAPRRRGASRPNIGARCWRALKTRSSRRARKRSAWRTRGPASRRASICKLLFVFEALLRRAIRARGRPGGRSPPDPRVFRDMELTLTAYVENAEDQMLKSSAQHMVKSVEEEVRVAHQTAKSRADDLTGIVEELSPLHRGIAARLPDDRRRAPRRTATRSRPWRRRSTSCRRRAATSATRPSKPREWPAKPSPSPGKPRGGWRG